MRSTSGILSGILMLTIGQVLAGREHVISPISKITSWISAENFTTMIKKSFLYSRCCNVYSSDSTRGVKALFEQFINIYPNNYLLHNAHDDCQGYFLVGSTDKEIREIMQKMPPFALTAEILIIVDDELKNNSELFDASLYGHSNANVVSRFGMWNLLENYMELRFFQKVDSYDKLTHEFEKVNLRGRELKVCTLYRPPVSYLNTTISRTMNGTEVEVFPADIDAEKDGIEVKMFLLIAKQLNFTWIIRKPGGNYRFGRKNGTQWKGGIIQLMREQKVDLAFAGIWLTADHNAFSNMTEPWSQLFIRFLVPRPQPVTSFWALKRPFHTEVWLLLAASLLIKSVYMYARAKIDPKFPKRFRCFLSTITELIGRLLGTWVPRNTANARFELHMWQTVGVILVTAYCSSLAARLANWEYEDRIDTVRQFLEANLSWGRKGQPPPFSEYFDLNDPYASQMPAKYMSVKDDEATHQLIQKGGYAILGRIIGSIFFPEDEIIHNEDLKGYRVMKQTVGQFYTSFVVQPWLLQPINTIIFRLKESGVIQFHIVDVLRRKASSTFREVLEEHEGHDETARVLELTPLGAGFAALVLGFSISVIIFICELRRGRIARSLEKLENIGRRDSRFSKWKTKHRK